ncbi:MAG: DUF3343 domain-containing protein [Firmicutes bacterium]|nr:DUF3343 domain-containing protein [Bacillota bacterium]
MSILITFESTHHALAAENLLLDAGLQPDLQPVPRELSSSCGLAIALAASARHAAIHLLQEHSVRYKAIYRVSEGKGNKYEEVLVDERPIN